MTYDGGRSLDDQPLAAYGGSGMELTPEDEAKIDAAPPMGGDPELDAATAATPGAEAHASPVDPLIEGEPGAAGRSTAGPAIAVASALALRGATLLRTSRPAQGAAFGTVIVVGLLLLVGGGPKPGAVGAEASPTMAPVVVATREPGAATLEVSGKLEQSLAFTGMTGAGAPTAPIAATWTDTAKNSLGIEGAPDRGTRITDEHLVLRFTVTVKEKPVTFTSTGGECAIGMGMNARNVSGSFSCHKLASDDGKYVVEATGTYRT